MSEKIFDGFVHSFLFLFFYGLFGGLYSGLILPMDSGGRLALAAIYGAYSILIAIWFLYKALEEYSPESRKLSATLSLGFIALFITCGLAFLMPETLLQTSVLWFFFKSCCITAAAILVAVLVMFVVFSFQGED